jgi:hypothetical protein
MRPTPPFDPRIQQGPIYAPGPSPMYLQQVVHPTQLPQYNYPQSPQYSPPYSLPTYPITPQHQNIPQMITNIPTVQTVQIPNIPTQVTVTQPQPGFVALQPQL